MSNEWFDVLLERMPKIADAVNVFKSEKVQYSAFQALLAAVGADIPDDEIDEDDAEQGPDRKKQRGKGRQKARTDNSRGSGKGRNTRRHRGRQGGAAILGQLLDEGYFSQPRTLNAIIEHSTQRKAKTFKPNELSSPLARFTRAEKLTRQKNKDGQYEYKKP